MTEPKKFKLRVHHPEPSLVKWARASFIGVAAVTTIQILGLNFDDGPVFYLSAAGAAVLTSFCLVCLETIIKLVRNARKKANE